MMNDLILTKEEELLIANGTEDERRAQLMTQLLPGLELLNAAKPRHILLRSNVLFRVLLRDEDISKDIAEKCRGFDLENRFEHVARIPLRKWLSLVFASWAYYMGRSRDDLIEHPEFFVINRNSFISQSAVTQEEMDAFLATTSSSLERLCQTLSAERSADPRFDFVPFRSTPLYSLKDGNFACADTAFLIEKLYSGVHWTIHDGISESERDDLFKAWGRLFEHYVDWLFKGMTNWPAAFFSFPTWDNREEAFDGIFLNESLLIPMEYKGGFLSQEAKYSGKTDALAQELERKFVPGCRQLAKKIASLFDSDVSRRNRLAGVPVQHVQRVLPLLIVQDGAFGGLFLNWWLNRRFRQILSSYTISATIEVLSLNVVHIDVAEALVESAEGGDFDFIHALHHKAVRDPDMLYVLHNFLFVFPGYGKYRAARLDKIRDDVKQELLLYLFPREPGTPLEK